MSSSSKKPRFAISNMCDCGDPTCLADDELDFECIAIDEIEDKISTSSSTTGVEST